MFFPIFPTVAPKSEKYNDATASKESRKRFLLACRKADYSVGDIRRWLNELWGTETTIALKQWQIDNMLAALNRQRNVTPTLKLKEGDKVRLIDGRRCGKYIDQWLNCDFWYTPRIGKEFTIYYVMKGGWVDIQDEKLGAAAAHESWLEKIPSSPPVAVSAECFRTPRAIVKGRP